MNHNIPYSPMELAVMQVCLEIGYTTKKIADIVERPEEGVYLKLKRLRRKHPKKWNYRILSTALKDLPETKNKYLASKKYYKYHELEIEVLRNGVEKGLTLLGLEELLGRPYRGILQKINKLEKENPEEWDHGVVKKYQRESYSMNRESFRKHHRTYRSKNKEWINEQKRKAK
ncbi:MAG: hypothetical protein Q8R00_02010 [Candidatus Nanoarchaeia archaeon]|nr:hypothetical protein [Candidatus Nanoarchaeia archaeon]